MSILEKYPELVFTLVLNMDNEARSAEMILQRIRRGVHSEFLCVSEIHELIERAIALGLVEEGSQGFYIRNDWWQIINAVGAGADNPDIASLWQSEFFEELSKKGVSIANAIALEKSIARSDQRGRK